MPFPLHQAYSLPALYSGVPAAKIKGTHFDYCDSVYDGHITIRDASRLETLQNRATRLVTGTLFRTPTDKLLQDLGWDKLSIRRRIHKLRLYYTLNNDHKTPTYIRSMMPNTRVHNTGRILRNANEHTIPSIRTSSFQQSFFPSTSKLWNHLHQSTRSLSYPSFKRAISERLGVLDPGLCSTQIFRVDSTLTHVTIQVTQL